MDLYYAVCRECLGADDDCWRCKGQALYRVQHLDDADLVFGCRYLSGDVGVHLGMEATPRLQAWLDEQLREDGDSS